MPESNRIRHPNFFIIGAAKSGTTSLYHALRQHPDIFLSDVKEPMFFAFNGEPPVFSGPAGSFLRNRTVWQSADYLRLFAHATHHRAIGEASTIYLDTPAAARNIRNQLPDSRLIALLRHPVDRAYSNYMFFREKGFETERSFLKAMRMEKTRQDLGWSPIFQYYGRGCYGRNLSLYYDLFPRQQIRVCLFEDLVSRPTDVLRDLLRFLEVDESFPVTLPRTNVTRIPRWSRFHRIAKSLGRKGRYTAILPDELRRALSGGLIRLNQRLNLHVSPPLDPQIRADLVSLFREDILRLQDTIGRDLSSWLNCTYTNK